MKKAVFILMFVIECGAVFAELVYTSEGYYSASIAYDGSNKDLKVWVENAVRRNRSQGYTVFNDNIKLTKGQRECVNKLLNRYETSKGDCYVIGIALEGKIGVLVFILFSSSTEYQWRAINVELT
jgi:hypothetical protein